jgi:ABC-2 type transport system permease protein
VHPSPVSGRSGGAPAHASGPLSAGGGHRVPTFIFPAWLQQSMLVPVRWAVDGLDAMTWRGIGLSGAVVPGLVLIGFGAAFSFVAASRFRWEEALTKS